MARKTEKLPISKTPAIDPGTIRELAKLLDETGLTEIEIEADGASIRVARNLALAAPRGRQGCHRRTRPDRGRDDAD